MLRAHSVLLNTALIASALGLVALSGCQGDTPAETTGGGGEGPVVTNGNTSTGSNGGGGDSSTTSTSDSSTGSTTGSSSSTGGGSTCVGDTHTVQEITDGTVGPDVKVKLEGVVAMSKKFLVYGSKSSCLWGIFVSAPGLDTTGPNTGVLVESYGANPTQDADGKMTCPANPADAGDKLPNAKPGDVITVIGKTSAYKPSTCGAGSESACTDGSGGTQPYDPSKETANKQIQLAQVCSGEITGTAKMPTPAVFDSAKIAELKEVDNQAFFNQWGGVKIRIENTKAVLQTIGDINQPEGCFNKKIEPGALTNYGALLLEGGIYVTNDPFYIKGSSAACESGPWVKDNKADLTMNMIQGFVSLDYCTWKLYASSPCDDYNPASTKCAEQSVTTCF